MAAYIESMERTHSLTSFSDDELLRRLSDLLGQSRRDEADLVAHIGEVDGRRLYAREASPSMFGYCTEVLHLSEAEAYLRIAAARAARASPAPDPARRRAAAPDGHREAGAAPHPGEPGGPPEPATHQSKREIEELVAELAPRPDAPAVMRKLPDRRGGMTSTLTGPRRGAAWTSSRTEVLRAIANCVQTESRRPASNCVWTDRMRRPGVERCPPERLRCRPSPARPAVVEPLARPLQGPVHRLRRASRQARAAAGPHALLGARRRPGRDHRAAVTEKLQRLEARRFAQTPGAEEDALAEPDLPHDAPGPGRGEASRLRARRRPMPLRRRTPGRRCTARQGSSSITGVRSATAATTRSVTSRSRANATTAYLAEIDYGREAVARHRRSRDPSSGADAVCVAVTTASRGTSGRTVVGSHCRAFPSSRPGNAGRLELGPVIAQGSSSRRATVNPPACRR